MHEELTQKISQLLDDELPQEEALRLLQKMRTLSKLSEKLGRYEAISHVIRNEVFVPTDPHFVQAVSQKILSEPTYLLPGANRHYSPPHRWKRTHKIAAAAASVAVIAIIAHTQRSQPDKTTLQIAMAKSSSDQSQTPKSSEIIKGSEPYSINQQINDYLQAHNSSVYTNGQANFQPYAQVTRYSQK